MGCYPPLVKIASKLLGKCNGARRERWREERLDYAMAYPPTKTHYMQPMARTVTFAAANSVYVIPPEPPTPQPQDQQSSSPAHQAPPPQREPDHQPQQTQPESSPPATAPAPEQTKAEEDGTPPPAAPKPPKGPKRGKKKQPGRVRFGPEKLPPPQQQQQQESQGADGGGGGHEPSQRAHAVSPSPVPAPAPAQGQGYLFRYTPSPLPRWEATPRRHEYFSGEYRSYYPTPVREGIYSIATDANRLTTIFSEENPNACAIV